MTALACRRRPGDPARQHLAREPEISEIIGARARRCLDLELDTWPKPGLVSCRDSGSHHDMDAALLARSAAVLEPFFANLAAAGATGAGMDRLRAIGIDAERAMLAATGGANTHRGAIFGLGLLCAAAGRRGQPEASLGAIVRDVWGDGIRTGPAALHSHGSAVRRRYGAGGARGEAAAGFPAIYGTGLPAYRTGLDLRPDDPEAARVQAVFALIAAVEDTNLLHRGGPEGLRFAQGCAARFLAEGGVATADWRGRAVQVHAAFVARRLSPGGAADLLAMTLFVHALEPAA